MQCKYEVHGGKMSMRAKFLGFVDVIMRIPPLFLLDEILKMNLFETGSFETFTELNETINSSIASNVTESAAASLDFYGISLTVIRCLVFLIGERKFCVSCFREYEESSSSQT